MGAPHSPQTPTGLPCEAAQRFGPTVTIFGIEIDQTTMDGALDIVLRWLEDEQSACRYIVTPNVDHVVQLEDNSRLRQAYAGASLVIADGWPLVAFSHLCKKPLPERITGVDFVASVFSSATLHRRIRTFLLGAAPGVAEKAARRVMATWPGVDVVGNYSPPPGFESDPRQCTEILKRVADAAPDFLIVGFGAPKQENWLHASHKHLPVKVAIAAGATIDFLAGEQPRAPRWMQRAGFEWLYRIGTDPRRLALRYARDAWRFPPIAVREWLRLCRNR